MVDFSKFLKRTPEEREASWKETQKRVEARQERNKLMVNKLYAQLSEGFIENEFAESFIVSVKARIDQGIALTDRQEKVLEDLFERY